MDNRKSNILAIDTSVAGIAGDMFISALFGLIKNKSEVLINITESIEKTSNFQFQIKFEDISYQGFKGRKLVLSGNKQKLTADQLKKILEEALVKLNVHEKYNKIAISSLNLLLEAEENVHSTTKVHLHELGTLDTIIDIIGVCYLLQKLNIESIQISPVAIGQGVIETKHGILPVPAPATNYILEKTGLPTIIGPNGEACTPTGIALLAAISTHLSHCDTVSWIRSSFGFGHREWTDRGNFLRVRIGEKVAENTKISILETHIDDATGEILGHTMESLMEKGALDVSYYPIFMKKGRPAYCLRVICLKQYTDNMSQEIIKMTGSLGVRILDVQRHVGKRKFEKQKVKINEREVEFTIKYGEYTSKVEFEDIVRISKELNISPNQLQAKLFSVIKERNK